MWLGINPWSHRFSDPDPDPSPVNFRENLIPDCDWWGAGGTGTVTLTKLWSRVIGATENAGKYFLWSSVLCISKDCTWNRKREGNISNIWFVDQSNSSVLSWKQAWLKFSMSMPASCNGGVVTRCFPKRGLREQHRGSMVPCSIPPAQELIKALHDQCVLVSQNTSLSA